MTEEPFFPPAYFNPKCQCRKEKKNPMYCMMGHLTECHYPYDCEEANCSHYQSEVDDEIDLFTDEVRTKQETKIKEFEVVGKCDCGKPILRYMLKWSSVMCAECEIMWSNEARFMQQ